MHFLVEHVLKITIRLSNFALHLFIQSNIDGMIIDVSDFIIFEMTLLSYNY